MSWCPRGIGALEGRRRAPEDLERRTISSAKSLSRSVVEIYYSKLDEHQREIEIDEHKLSAEELFRHVETEFNVELFRHVETGHSTKFAEELLAKNGSNALNPPKHTPEKFKFFK